MSAHQPSTGRAARPRGAAGRSAEILLALGRFGFGSLIDARLWRRWLPRSGPTPVAADPAEAGAVRLRRLFESLGPSFIKLGQLLALHADELPRPYRDELSRLLDRTLPIPFAELEVVLAEELGADWRDAFRDLDPEPLASASIGQVHRATLADGSPVAVKVQRPGAAEVFATDFSILRRLLRWSRLHVLLGMDAAALRGILDEVEAFTRGELDYTREARAAERLAGLDLEGVVVPRVFHALTTRRVLTTSFLDGVTVNAILAHRDDAAWLADRHVDRDRLALLLLRAQIRQALGHGFFQADPHPANLIALADGRLGYVDFGIVGELDETTRRDLVDQILFELVDDYEAVWPLLFRYAPPSPETDLRAFKAEFKALSQSHKADADRSFSGRSLGIYVEELLRLYHRHRLRVAGGWATYLRGVIVYGNTVAALSERVSFMHDTLPIYWELKLRQAWAPEDRERFSGALLRQAFELHHTLRSVAVVARQAEAGELTVQQDEHPQLARRRNLRLRAGVLTALSVTAVMATLAVQTLPAARPATAVGLTAAGLLLWRLAVVLRRLR